MKADEYIEAVRAIYEKLELPINDELRTQLNHSNSTRSCEGSENQPN